MDMDNELREPLDNSQTFIDNVRSLVSGCAGFDPDKFKRIADSIEKNLFPTVFAPTSRGRMGMHTGMPLPEDAGLLCIVVEDEDLIPDKHKEDKYSFAAINVSNAQLEADLATDKPYDGLGLRNLDGGEDTEFSDVPLCYVAAHLSAAISDNRYDDKFYLAMAAMVLHGYMERQPQLYKMWSKLQNSKVAIPCLTVAVTADLHQTPLGVFAYAPRADNAIVECVYGEEAAAQGTK